MSWRHLKDSSFPTPFLALILNWTLSFKSDKRFISSNQRRDILPMRKFGKRTNLELILLILSSFICAYCYKIYKIFILINSLTLIFKLMLQPNPNLPNPYVMSRHVVSLHFTSRHVTSCHVTSCHFT